MRVTEENLVFMNFIRLVGCVIRPFIFRIVDGLFSQYYPFDFSDFFFISLEVETLHRAMARCVGCCTLSPAHTLVNKQFVIITTTFQTAVRGAWLEDSCVTPSTIFILFDGLGSFALEK